MSEAVSKYIRAANYLSAVQIYLRDNFLLHEPLTHEHIKPRLLGHWGTCPGINFLYAHLNVLAKEHNQEMLFVLGPGHGFPAIQANLFLEGTLSKYYSEVPRNEAGIAYMAKQFSWPYGFPSHSNPTAPGVILEGGELGYSLSTSYGAVLDNPELVVACLIGDGEAETGPTATAWHINKLLDPATNGAVLPVLHVNGYKISGPTIYGRMSDEELTYLFRGYGYEPHIVDAYTEEDPHARLSAVLQESLAGIRFTQHCAREGTLTENPRFPMIIMRTPKGWGSIPELDGKRIEDNHYSHQVIAERAATDPEHLAALETWLRSYRFDELFHGSGFDTEIEAIVPPEHLRMGDSAHARGGDPHYKELALPSVGDYVSVDECPLTDPSCERSSMEAVGEFLRDVMKANDATRNIRLFSPDETYSNKLHAVFEATARTFVWPHKEWDKDLAWDGRVMEMLSEHTLQGLAQGYVLTGRHAVFASYEAFVQIVGSMADQYAKYLSIAREVPWRGEVPSLNYILTSSGWRQEHNGFSHQNPGFIDEMLQRQGCFVNVYFPADAHTTLYVFDKMLRSTNEINVLVVGKRHVPVWRSPDEARRDVEEGIRIWDFASDDDPHMVFGAVGDYLTKETLAAVDIIKTEIPDMRLRFVNITSLTTLGVGSGSCGVLPHSIDHFFTTDKPVLINFHGYPQTIKQLFFDYGYDAVRFDIRGYEERGSTTTPFDMQIRNRTDRWHLAIAAFNRAREEGVIDEMRCSELVRKYEQKLTDHRAYIVEHGDDPAEISEWRWHRS